jgi:hypothetical protein
MYNINIVVSNLQNFLNLKTETELAEKLGMSRNAFSMLKKRNSVGTLLERILELPESEEISLDYIFSDDEKAKSIYLTCKKIVNTFNESEIIEIETNLKNPLMEKKDVNAIIEKFKTLKGVSFATKLSEMMHGRGERMSVILYKFLKHIAGNILMPVEKEYAKKNFINALKSFRLTGINGALFREEDKNNLLDWMEQELDDDDYYMILSDIAGVAEKLKTMLNIINRATV